LSSFAWTSLALLGFVGSFVLTAFSSALRRGQRKESKRQLKALGKWFFYRPFHHLITPHHEFDGLLFATICAQSLCRFVFTAAMAASLLIAHSPWYFWPSAALLFFALADYLPRLWGNYFPEVILRFAPLFASPFLLLTSPLTYLFRKLTKDPITESKQELMEMIQEADFGTDFDPHNKKLLESVVTFQDRIAREVMVPRVNVFSLKSDTPIRLAAEMLQNEGYSRTPVYKQTVDQIVGVLMYKDILTQYMKYAQEGNDPKILDTPIDSIVKPVIYTPETKRISNLLQEFRKKQMHMAIVVDEYGGTEGIVTIEDILEEIVGEIEDEYDDESELVFKQNDGSWIIDARISILDLEDLIELEIPQEGEYDTLGGYIFHIAGSIPSRGFTIQRDNFTLEIVRSNERRVEKVRLIPHPHAIEPHEERG